VNPAPLQNVDHNSELMRDDIAAKATATVHGSAASVLESCEQQTARPFLASRWYTDHLVFSGCMSR
jgi:hypothetical protein